MTTRIFLKSFRMDQSASSNNNHRHAISSGSKRNEELLFEGHFKATKLWNSIIRRFCHGIPLKRHRRNFRTYDNCFTGREAIDFLMNELPKFVQFEKEITRTNCTLLLNKFMENKVIASVRDERSFKENEVYRIEYAARNGATVKRAASFNERNSLGYEAWKEINCSKSAQTPHNPAKPDCELFLPARIFFSDDNERPARSLKNSRRLSSSHGNLPSMITKKFVDSCESTSTNGTLKDYEVIKNSDFNRKDRSCLEKSDAENASRLDDVLSKLMKINEPSSHHSIGTNGMNEKFSGLGKFVGGVPINLKIIDQRKCTRKVEKDVSSHDNLRNFGKVLQCRARENSNCLNKKEVSDTIVKDVNSTIINTWKVTLLNRLKNLLQVNNINDIIDYEFSGYDIKWNCERIGIKGVVKAMSSSDDLSTYMFAMMRFLTRWPFDDKVIDSKIVYPGMELNVFENICDYFINGKSIMPPFIAISIINIVKELHKRNLQLSHRALRMETVFLNTDTPVRRLISAKLTADEKSLNETMNGSLAPSIDSTILTKTCEEKATVNKGTANVSPEISPFSVSTVSAISECRKYGETVDSVYAHLPGMKNSPELMDRLKELKRTHSSDHLNLRCNYASSFAAVSGTLSIESKPLFSRHNSNFDHEFLSTFLECAALVLLTIRPAIRRRLHYLLRFMQKISSNHCLRLDTNLDNRFIVLHRLSECIIKPCEEIDSDSSLQLVAFLVDNESQLFAIPNLFQNEVEAALRYSKHGDVDQTNNFYSTNAVQEHIVHYRGSSTSREHVEQKENDIEQHLLLLLDEIVDNETIAVGEKKRQLTKFKKTYPEIYGKRFPSPKLASKTTRTPSILRRFRKRFG